MPTKKSALTDPSTSEALARELSFNQIRELVREALEKEYPLLGENGQSIGYGCRYHIQQIWPDKALVNSSYYQAEGDAKFALTYFTVAEDKKSASLDKFVPVQIIASPLEDKESPVVLDEAALVVADDVREAGKRNSKSDAKKINAALRAMIDMMDAADVEEETLAIVEKWKKTKKETKEEYTLPVPSGETQVEESGWDALEGETISENFTLELQEASIDEKSLIIKNTVILGPVSLNKRRYPEDVQKAAVGLFEGVKAYLNHPPIGSVDPRDVRDLIGTHKNVRVVEGKMRSDLHLIDNVTVREHVLPIAKSQPNLIGNSIVARVVMERAKDGFEEIKKIMAARSVDLVAEPGTTSGLFESHTPAAMQEDTMDLKTLTVEQLRTERADLIEALLADRKHADEVAELKAKTETMAQEATEKDRKLAEYEMKETARVRAQLISDLVASMKAPDAFKYETVEGKKVIKGTLARVLDRCQTQTDMEAAVQEWEAICQEAQKKPEAPTTPLSFESAITTGDKKVTRSPVEQLHAALVH